MHPYEVILCPVHVRENVRCLHSTKCDLTHMFFAFAWITRMMMHAFFQCPHAIVEFVHLNSAIYGLFYYLISTDVTIVRLKIAIFATLLLMRSVIIALPQ